MSECVTLDETLYLANGKTKRELGLMKTGIMRLAFSRLK
jgi:hypothetical protein